MDFLDEGRNMSTQKESDRLKLEAIKAHKIQSLHVAGVPQKYTVDLEKKRFS